MKDRINMGEFRGFYCRDKKPSGFFLGVIGVLGGIFMAFIILIVGVSILGILAENLMR